MCSHIKAFRFETRQTGKRSDFRQEICGFFLDGKIAGEASPRSNFLPRPKTLVLSKGAIFMYVYSGYLNHGDMELEDYAHPLIVTGCGIYRLIRQPIMHTIRAEGRKDYQLLYISSGKAFFEFPEGTVEVSAGEMILYRPGVPQRYWYLVEDRPEVCWIHFTGSQAESYLNEAGFSKKHQLHVGISPEYRELFRQIIGELQLRRPCFEEFPPHYLRLLFAEIHRSQKEGTLSLRPNQEGILRAVQDFNESFAAPISIQEYAASRHMSVCWFIRSFRNYMGMAPMQYITFLRITRAKELLRSTDYPIQEIGSIVGYENPLYFSRIFKKQTGYSPSEYRSAR